jgi:hypothetical protein
VRIGPVGTARARRLLLLLRGARLLRLAVGGDGGGTLRALGRAALELVGDVLVEHAWALGALAEGEVLLVALVLLAALVALGVLGPLLVLLEGALLEARLEARRHVGPRQSLALLGRPPRLALHALRLRAR